MRKGIYIAAGILVALFVLLVFLEGNRKEPLSWKQTFSGTDKIPYGTYVTKDMLNELYPENTFSVNSDGIYMFLKINPEPENFKMIYITRYFRLDSELDQLLEIAKKGNDVFIAAEYFDEGLMDTLEFSTNHYWTDMTDSNRTDIFHFRNQSLDKKDGFKVSTSMAECYFDSVNGENTAIVAENAEKKPVLIKSRFGKGDFYLSTSPLLFTNYNVLYGNADYPFTAFSCLRGRSFIWDEYYKPYRVEIETPIRYVLTQPALKAAYTLLIMTLIIYFLFKGKRLQRVIPVIQPPKNQTLDYVKTIGRMYFNNGNNRDIAMKKYYHFCDYLRNKYTLRNFNIDNDFYKMLSDKSGVDSEIIAVIFKLAAHIQYQSWTSDEVLMSFNDKIEEFYERTK